MPTLTGDQLAADEDAWRQATLAGIKRHKQAAAAHKKRERVVQKLLVHRKRLQRKVKDAVAAAYSDEDGAVSSEEDSDGSDGSEDGDAAQAATMHPELRRLHEQHEAEQTRSKEAARSYHRARRALHGVKPVASIESHDPAVALLAYAESAVHCSQEMIARCAGPSSATSDGDSGQPRRAKRPRPDVPSAAGGQSAATGGSGLTSKEHRRRATVGKQAEAAAERGELNRMKMLAWYKSHVREHAAAIRQTRLDLLAWWRENPLHALVLFVATQTRTQVYNLVDGQPLDGHGASPTKQWDKALDATLDSVDILEKMDSLLGAPESGIYVPPDNESDWDDWSSEWDDLVADARAAFGETLATDASHQMQALASALCIDAGSVSRFLLEQPETAAPTSIVDLLQRYVSQVRETHGVQVDRCYETLYPLCADPWGQAMDDAANASDPGGMQLYMIKAAVAVMDSHRPDDLELVRRSVLEYLVPAHESLEALQEEITESSKQQRDLVATEARLTADMSLNFAIVGVARGVYTALLNRFQHLVHPDWILEFMWDSRFNSLYDVFASLVAMQVCLNDRTSSMRPSYKGADHLLVAEMYQLSYSFNRARLVKRKDASGMEHLYLEGGAGGSAERQTWSLTSLAHRRMVMEKTRLYVTQPQ